MKSSPVLPVFVVGLSAMLTGCYKSTRLVERTQAPDVYRSASVDVLQKELSERDTAVKTLTASVMVTFSTGGGKEGKVTTYTSVKGFIFVRKPNDLRVIMLLPVVGSRAGDMVSNGDTFTLLIPPKSLAYQGTKEVTKPSPNALENLRPAAFFDSLLVPGVAPDEYVSLDESTRILEPEQKHKPAIEEPDYDLTIVKIKKGNVLQTLRVVHISRTDMLPFQQDVYDNDGHVVTQSTYKDYKSFDGQMFPTVIRVRRPLDELEIKMEVSKVTLNQQLEDDQFDLKIPSGYTVKKLE